MKCWICGKKSDDLYTRSNTIGSNRIEHLVAGTKSRARCYCKSCVEKVIDDEKREIETYSIIKHKIMFYKACNTLEEQKVDLYKYKDAIDVVYDKVVSDPDKFDSSYEVMTAIILVHNRIYSKMQYPVGRYRVDFFLEDDGIVLEIDGDRHKYSKKADSERDTNIKKILGLGWEIIRIDTKYLDENATRLPVAIKKIMEYRETNHINWRKL